MASEIHQLHFVLIPLMSQSHIIPLTDFAKLLAKRGLIVSIITTPLNSIRYKSTVDHAVQAGLKIRLIPLDFPCQEFGLPPGCENIDSLTSLDSASDFLSACEKLKFQLEKLMREMEPNPSCIVSTNVLYWTQSVADKFDIPRYVFETVSCFTLFCSLKLSQAKIQELEIQDREPFMVPGIPDRILFTKAQLPESVRKTSDNVKGLVDKMLEARSSARGTLVNSFEELEHCYVNGFKKGRQNVWCIGPVSLCNTEIEEKSGRGNKAAIDERFCTSWLDSKKPNSVIYVCFGSLCRMSAAQIKEIGFGLEESGSDFIWIIRGLDCSEEVEKWLDEENFEQRVEGKGLIIRGWAPQVLILSHPSVGGFLTHCGWNSTLEAVSAGVPMATWPMFAEQFYNEKFIVQVLKIGTRIGVEVATKRESDEKSEGFVKRGQVKECVEKLMGGGDEGIERIRAQNLGEMAKEALGQGGSSHTNISLLIQDVMRMQK